MHTLNFHLKCAISWLYDVCINVFRPYDCSDDVVMSYCCEVWRCCDKLMSADAFVGVYLTDDVTVSSVADDDDVLVMAVYDDDGAIGA